MKKKKFNKKIKLIDIFRILSLDPYAFESEIAGIKLTKKYVTKGTGGR